MRVQTSILATCVAAMLLVAAEPAAADLGEQVTVNDNSWAVAPGTWSIGPGVESDGRFNSIDFDGNSVTFESNLDKLNNYGGWQIVTLTYEWGALPRRIVGVSEPVFDRDSDGVADRGGGFIIDAFTDNSVTFGFQGDWGADSVATFELQTEPAPASERLQSLLQFMQEDLAEAAAEVVRGDVESAQSFLDSVEELSAALVAISQEEEFGPGSQLARLAAKVDRAAAKARRATAGTTLRKLRAAQRIVKISVLLDKLRERLEL